MKLIQVKGGQPEANRKNNQVARKLLIVGVFALAVRDAQNAIGGGVTHGDFGLWEHYWMIRNYSTPNEEVRRQKAFWENDAIVEATYEPFLKSEAHTLLARNMFADTTEEEWIKLDQPYPEPDDDDWGEQATRDNDDPDWDKKQQVYLERFKYVNSSWTSIKAEPFNILEGQKMPLRIDWRRRLVVPNYEAICCTVDCRHGTYAWAVIVTLVSHLNIRLLEDERKGINARYPTMYSTQQLIDCIGTDDVNFYGQNICQSTALGGNGRPNSVVRAYKHVIMNGLMSDVNYNYRRGKYSDCKYNKAKVEQRDNPFTGFVKLNRYDEVALVQALALYGPITVSFNANMKYYWLYDGGILIPTECKPGKTVSMVLVGYGVERDIKYWLLMSPWGERWGRSGMLKLKWFSDVKGCNIAGQAIFPTWDGRENVTSYDWDYWKDIEEKRAKYVKRVYTDDDLNDRRRIYDPKR